MTELLSAADLDEIRSLQRQVAEADDHGLTVDYMRPDRTAMRMIREQSATLWSRVLPRLFVDHRPAMATFVVKHPGHESAMFLHDDRSYVDERLGRSHTLWIPLDEVGPDLDNGGLEVIPGSHRLAQEMGGTGTPDLFRPYERFLRTQLVRPAVRPGQVVVYDSRTLHASGPNLSDRPRAALVCAVAPSHLDLVHVVATSDTSRAVHRVDRDFFVDNHPSAGGSLDRTRYPVERTLDVDPTLTATDVAANFGCAPPEANPIVADRVRRPGDPDVLDWLPVETVPARSRSSPRSPSGGPIVTTDVVGGDVEAIGSHLRLEPGSTVRATVGSRSAALRVVDVPRVAAGVRSGDRAATLVPGQRVLFEVGDVVEIWNDGPSSADLRFEGVRRRRAARRRRP